MVELQAPIHTEPTKPVRKYYVHQAGVVVPRLEREQTETADGTVDDKTTPNEPVIDDYEYKELWHEYEKDKEQWKRGERE